MPQTTLAQDELRALKEILQVFVTSEKSVLKAVKKHVPYHHQPQAVAKIKSLIGKVL